MSPAYLLTIFTGGSIGSVLRYFLSHRILISYGSDGFRWATLLVNIIGSLSIGWIYGCSNLHDVEWMRPLIIIGLLGGFYYILNLLTRDYTTHT